jgi:hypothetical protein
MIASPTTPLVKFSLDLPNRPSRRLTRLNRCLFSGFEGLDRDIVRQGRTTDRAVATF